MNKSFWRDRKVLVTGHTGFKGSWLCMCLKHLGADIVGFSLDPPTNPNLFTVANVGSGITDLRCDIRDRPGTNKIFKDFQPEVAFHLAAQPLVRYSYLNPIETYETNFNGTLNFLEALRHTESIKTAVIVTTDKCYENQERQEGYKEDDPMGGFDPYSSSKGAAELLISAYRNSYFPVQKYDEHQVGIASARAGNVIGGGDWADDRLVPDILNSLMNNDSVKIRNPYSVRPWQHVLEPIFGYLRLAENLTNEGPKFSEGWNFGPDENDAQSVQWIVENIIKKWKKNGQWILDANLAPHEAHYLMLDCSKSREKLNWGSVLTLDEALNQIVKWHEAYNDGFNMEEFCYKQIEDFEAKIPIRNENL